MLRTAAILLALSALAPSPARAQVRAASIRAEAGGSLGLDPRALGTLSFRASATGRPLALEASLDLGGWARGGLRTYDLALLGGAGVSVPVRAHWRGSALLVGGLHALGTEEADGPGYQDHALPAAGVRVAATLEHARGPSHLFLAVTLSATVLADLRRQYNVFLGEDVGGWTALVTATMGIGLGRW